MIKTKKTTKGTETKMSLNIEMVDSNTRNNYIVLVIIGVAIILISTNIFLFSGWIVGIANHIDHVVEETGNNMTKLTVVLIEQGKAQSLGLNKVVDNQTAEFVKAMGNFTNVVINYSGENDRNLNNISTILTDINANTKPKVQ